MMIHRLPATTRGFVPRFCLCISLLVALVALPQDAAALMFRAKPTLTLPDFTGQSEHTGRNPIIAAARENFSEYTQSLQRDQALFFEAADRLELMTRILTPRIPLFEKVAKENALATPGEIWRVMNAWAHYLHHLGRLEMLARTYHFSMTDLWKDDEKTAFE
ncbi:MAG TPA: hypothetical protein PKO06_12320, partial [Candidatus Ozemobacteraceae bacterium]|nr:hypothetical protein [Candidatus Ozemobacteraceae bacterium]